MPDSSDRFWRQYGWALRLTLSRRSVWMSLLLATAIQLFLVANFFSESWGHFLASSQKPAALQWTQDWSRYGTYLPGSNLIPKSTDTYVNVVADLDDPKSWGQLTRLKELKGLQLQGSALKGKEKTDRRILENLPCVPRLERLSLNGFILSREDFKQIATLSDLNYLDLEQSQVKGGLEELSDLPHLKTLVLGDNSLGNSEVLPQARSLKSLQVLGLGNVWAWSGSRFRTARPIDFGSLTSLLHLRAIYAAWEPQGQQTRISQEELQRIAVQRAHLRELLPRVWQLPMLQPRTIFPFAINYWLPFFFLCLFGGMHFQGQFQYLGRMTYPNFLTPHLLAAVTALGGLSLQFLVPALFIAPWPPFVNFFFWSMSLVTAVSVWGRTQVPNPKANTRIAVAMRFAIVIVVFGLTSSLAPAFSFLGRIEPWYADALYQMIMDFFSTGILWKSILCVLAAATGVTLGILRFLHLYRRLLELGVSVPAVTMQRDWGLLGQSPSQSVQGGNPLLIPQDSARLESLAVAGNKRLGYPGISLLRSIYPRNYTWWVYLTGILCGIFVLPGMFLSSPSWAGWNMIIPFILIQMTFQIVVMTYSFWTRRLTGLGYELLVKPMAREQIRRDMLRVYARDVAPFCLTIIVLSLMASFASNRWGNPVYGSLVVLWSTTGFCVTFFGVLYFVVTLRSMWKAVIIMFACGIASFVLLTLPYMNPPQSDDLGKFMASPNFPLLAGCLFWPLGLGVFFWAYCRWWTLEFP